VVQLGVAVGGAHRGGLGVGGPVGKKPLQGEVHEPLAQGTSVLPLQVPGGAAGDGGLLLLLLLLAPGAAVLGVGLGLLVGGQLLAVQLVQVAGGWGGRALAVGRVAAVLLALGLLPRGGHVDVVQGLLQAQALQGRQRGAGSRSGSSTPTAAVAAAAAAGPAQGLLLDGQQGVRVGQVAEAELLLDEAVQDRSSRLLRGSHLRQFQTRPGGGGGRRRRGSRL